MGPWLTLITTESVDRETMGECGLTKKSLITRSFICSVSGRATTSAAAAVRW